MDDYEIVETETSDHAFHAYSVLPISLETNQRLLQWAVEILVD